MAATAANDATSLSGNFNHSLTLTMPFPDQRSASIVKDVLRVDRQIRPKEVAVAYEVSGSDVIVTIDATSVRQLRLSVNAALENAALIVKTMDAFGPSSSAFAAYSNSSNPR
ncbi:hypothetical protein CF327_g5769 [Tilletia walkeri]|nr:hypothetical protein CF327_g5769 [Tilletia walkeri]KAE8228896.1 hypothetical protein CF326_g6151 [Tilletia indica]